MDKTAKLAACMVCIMLAGSSLLYAEPSVYGFGSSESTSSRSSQRSVSANRSITALKQKIAQQDERIDGLTTIIEGLSASLNELQMKRIEPPVIVESGQSNDALLQKLAAMIDDINENYVSKEELQKALGKKNVSKKKTGKSSVKTDKKEKDSLQGKSNAKLYSEGVRLFVKKRYSEAHKRFTVTDTKGYKPAASNYYLGEIAYYTKKYEDAIFYFKKSAGIYDQASYIDTLLLHTAVSLEKSGDKGQAKAFYENIIENYSGKKSAKIAKQRLKKL
jgi:TolA-binding protein